MILPVIMAGGSGSRLWPLSRTHYPKQFHNLLGKSSLLIDTITRLDNIKHQPPLVICNEDHRFLVAEQFRKHSLSTSGIILEPIGKNTCPAIALAAFQAVKTNEDPYLLVLAADHSIGDRDSFQKAIHQAYETAKTGSLVTFGIIPTSPETGYGYIKKGKSLNKYAYYVDGFKEKPNIILANEYINSGHYLWNSGMFLFKASSFLKELKKFEPKIYRLCEESIDNSTHDLDFIRIDSDAFSNCKSQSVDIAIMEQTKNCAVVPMNADWSDVGSWSALWELSKKDDRNNYFYGDVVAIDCDSNFIRTDEKLTVTLGVKDLIVINTKDALLVAERSCAQKVKDVVAKLNVDNRNEISHYSNEFRSWGEIEKVDSDNKYIVNRIIIKPGAKISKQIHYHRSEHWIVVSGTASIVIDGKESVLTENESTFIKVGQEHSIMNPGLVPLIIIEIQSGSYVSEDDIIRVKEIYNDEC